MFLQQSLSVLLLLICTSTNLSGQAGEVFFYLLSGKGQTIGALIHGGIALMGADLDLIQRAVVLQITVMGALLYRTFNGLVGLHIHIFDLLVWITKIVCVKQQKT